MEFFKTRLLLFTCVKCVQSAVRESNKYFSVTLWLRTALPAIANSDHPALNCDELWQLKHSPLLATIPFELTLQRSGGQQIDSQFWWRAHSWCIYQHAAEMSFALTCSHTHTYMHIHSHLLQCTLICTDRTSKVHTHTHTHTLTHTHCLMSHLSAVDHISHVIRNVSPLALCLCCCL